MERDDRARVEHVADTTPLHPGSPRGGTPISAFVLEQTLGHVTHSANLRSLVPTIGGVEPVFLPVVFDPGPRRVPGWSNWTVRAGMRARRVLRGLRRATPPVHPDVMFVHTQVPAVLLGRWMRRIPTVVSVDATPLQYDELGESYAHERGPAAVERLKHRLNRRCFERAAHIVTWSEWARQGLVDGYGIAPTHITAIAPGVDLALWRRPAGSPRSADGVVRILFVGGDLRRKGGDVLVEACRRLREDPDLPDVEVHLVTMAAIDPSPGVVVHRGLTANSPALIAQYHAADIFCLPTLGDCLPMVLAEAAAAELPLVSTDVGAIREIVQPGVTGELVPVGDVDALTLALRTLVADAELRQRYGQQARRLAEQCHDAGANATRIIAILRSHARA